MKELGVRVLVLIVAATALGTLIMWFGAFLSGLTAGWAQYAVLGLLGILYVAVLIGVWKSFDMINP